MSYENSLVQFTCFTDTMSHDFRRNVSYFVHTHHWLAVCPWLNHHQRF